MPTDDAVSVWLDQLQAGESAAVRPLWERYFHRLVGLARTRLRNSTRRTSDEEDVALSAFDSFCRNAEAGRFPDLTDRESLWRLLAEFTIRKVHHHVRDAAALKRGGTALHDSPSLIEEVMSREPDPAMAAEMADRCDQLLAALPADDGDLRRIAFLRMEGYSVEEVGEKVGFSPRSVKRKLGVIRKIWLAAGAMT